MEDELADRLETAGIEVTPEQLETIRAMVFMITVSRGAYDPIEAVIVLLKPPGMDERPALRGNRETSP